jgi:hypothetical protein
MSEIKDEKQKDISTEYVMKFFHEDARMSGFMYGKILRIRNIMKAWKTESTKQDKDSPEEEVNRS